MKVEPLSVRHGSMRTAFDCGVESLNFYLRRQASQDAKRKIAAVFILVDAAERGILGYYTLSSLSVRLPDLPGEVAKGLPRYPQVPATLLRRLAVAQQYHGQGLGQHLLTDALHRALAASKSVASFAVVVDASNERAAAFYMRSGFLAFSDRPGRLFLPMKTIERIFG